MMSAEPGPAPHVRRNGGRKSTACRRCHRQKVKCTKETPCRNCRTAKVECIYAARDDTLTVSRSYLRSLEADRDRRRWRPRSPLPASDTTRDEDASLHAGRYGGEAPSPQQTVENSAAEAFLAKVNQLRQTATFSAVADPAPDDGGGEPSGVETGAALPPSTYEYFHLDFDTSCPPISLRLPPYPYAIHLLDEFEIYLGHDYHWFMRRRFKQRMERTYKSSDLPESRDRLWLCRLLIVFALGETYIKYPAPVIHLGSAAAAAATGADGSTAGRGHDDPALATPALPGTAFFEQALALLKLPCEETDLEHIEVINLATFYSYSLNRKRAAYSYAGIGARMCNLLRLHQPPPPQGGQGLSAAEQEHRKRVCWTSYCLDKMTSSELGLLPSFQPGQIKVDLPRDDQLRPEDAAEFHEAEFLRARIQLTFMKAEADVVIDLTGCGTCRRTCRSTARRACPTA
ncbi:hypothetical protein VTK73DRAFT_8463 [Phialemonium thermophilum]|uniref:Zn(2)-C6 fungal-type domain-containing protein n=1 Tax=Phialemonium thermophilum TaxID=223376 RepID=A0ABR3W8H0_9PEZI